MPPGMLIVKISPWILVSELIFTLLAVAFCLLIYFKTKKIYDLTKHEGINYFRMAFLFFGLSYLLRFILRLIFLSRIAFDFIIPREAVLILFILPLSYLSTMGIFYMIYVNVWKKFQDGWKKNSKWVVLLGHIAALALCIVPIITRSPFMLSIMQFALLIIATVLGLFIKEKGRKITHTRVLYFLVIFLWLINLIVIDNRRPMPLWVDILFELISVAIFIMIYHKLSKWVK